jgi:hypothetical protein
MRNDIVGEVLIAFIAWIDPLPVGSGKAEPLVQAEVRSAARQPDNSKIRLIQ